MSSSTPGEAGEVFQSGHVSGLLGKLAWTTVWQLAELLAAIYLLFVECLYVCYGAVLVRERATSWATSRSGKLSGIIDETRDGESTRASTSTS